MSRTPARKKGLKAEPVMPEDVVVPAVGKSKAKKGVVNVRAKKKPAPKNVPVSLPDPVFIPAPVSASAPVFPERRRRADDAYRDSRVGVQVSYKTLKWAVAGVFACGVLAVAAGWVKYGRAETLTLYPKACLGGWNNPVGASGVPDVLGHAAADFNTTNSAWVSGTLSQIYCGSFQGDIPDNTSPTKLVVHLSWALRGAASGGGASNSGSGSSGDTNAGTTTITGDSFASSTDALLDTLSNAPSALLIPIENLFNQSSSSPSNPPDTTGTPPSSDTTPPPPASAPAAAAPDAALPSMPAPTPTPDAPQSLAPLRSFFAWFFTPEKALAADASSTLDNMSSTTPANTDANTDASTTSPATTTSPASPTTPDDTVNDVLEVLYTFDGTTWQSLGTVTADQLASATFEIPLKNIQNWSDLSNVQISVRSLSGLTDGATVYLDGMQLEVGYGPTQSDVAEAQKEQKETAHIAYVASLPTKNLSITLGDSTDPNLSLNREKNSDNKEEIVIRAAQGSLAIYSDTDPGFSMATGVGDQPVHLAAYNFSPGQYTIISTTEPNACQQFTKASCMQDSHYVASARFSVSDVDGSTDPGTVSTSSSPSL